MSYITTYTGRHFDPILPDITLIDIEDIAHALSLTCRGNGHVKTFFSVAQHCINCALEAIEREYSPKVILACLLHDASEAYMSDVPSPFKQYLLDYQNMEDHLLEMIYTKFLGEPLTEDEKKLVKDIDKDMLYYDLKELLNHQSGNAPHILIELNYQFVPFEQIEQEYLKLFYMIERR